MQIKAVIFDLDGTLADTIEAIRDAINLTMKEYGYPPHTYEEIRVPNDGLFRLPALSVSLFWVKK